MQYVAVSYLNAPTYAVLYQLKILTTAVLSVTLLKKSLKPSQWAALCILTVGVSLVTLSQLNSSATNGQRKSIATQADVATGLVAVVLAAAVSGLAGVYFEMILKGSSTSLWLRNFQMSIYSIIIGVISLILGGNMTRISERGFFHGYTLSTWMAILNNALGGLLIAMVIKFADNIMKNFSQSLSIILTAIMSCYIFGNSLSLLFVSGCACVLYAIGLYACILSLSPVENLGACVHFLESYGR